MTLPSRASPTGRGYRRVRCAECRAPVELCFCAELEPCSARTRVTVVLHRTELRKPTNTGRLAARLLPRGELHVRGMPHEPPLELEHGGEVPLVLYPLPGALLLDAWRAQHPDAEVRLLVPDGTWSQTRRMVRREPALARAVAVRLPPGAPSSYTLRRPGPTGPDVAERLCTLEAIARALGVLEAGAVEHQLLSGLRLLVERGERARQPRRGDLQAGAGRACGD